jgi:predicted  nucleic acid-binding Zn-ribbon protein
MSTGAILTVLSHIPWGQVVENAPKVADGAARLWSTVTGSRAKASTADETSAAAGARSATDTEALRARVEALEETVRNLSEQMQVSSELIKALADQNTQLVQGIELNRVRLVRLAWATASACAALLGAVVFVSIRLQGG